MKVDTEIDQEILQLQLTEFAKSARQAVACNIAIVICAQTDNKHTNVAVALSDDAPKGMEPDPRYVHEVLTRAADAIEEQM